MGASVRFYTSHLLFNSHPLTYKSHCDALFPPSFSFSLIQESAVLLGTSYGYRLGRIILCLPRTFIFHRWNANCNVGALHVMPHGIRGGNVSRRISTHFVPWSQFWCHVGHHAGIFLGSAHAGQHGVHIDCFGACRSSHFDQVRVNAIQPIFNSSSHSSTPHL